MITTAVLLAGGFGTRLQAVVSDLPKPLAPVKGIPFLTYQLRYLKNQGIKKIVLSVGHLAQKIIDTYGSSAEGMEISYVTEQSPLGTGGATRLALLQCDEEEVFVLNADSFFDVDLKKFFRLHSASHAAASLATRFVDDASRYGTIRTGDDQRITAFVEKSGLHEPGRINGGVYILNKKTYLGLTPENDAFSIEKDFFEKQSAHLKLMGFEFRSYFIDIGIPEDYQRAQNEFTGFTYK